jgi:hypothetical protein
MRVLGAVKGRQLGAVNVLPADLQRRTRERSVAGQAVNFRRAATSPVMPTPMGSAMSTM